MYKRRVKPVEWGLLSGFAAGPPQGVTGALHAPSPSLPQSGPLKPMGQAPIKYPSMPKASGLLNVGGENNEDDDFGNTSLGLRSGYNFTEQDLNDMAKTLNLPDDWKK